MDFVKPKMSMKSKKQFELNNRTLSILKYYSKYTKYSESQILDMFLLNILKDDNFIKWVKRQRYNKKILAVISGTNSEEDFYELKDVDNEAPPVK